MTSAAALIVFMSFQSVLGIAILCFIGVLLVKYGVVDREKSTCLTKIVLNVLTPALLIPSVARSVDTRNVLDLWPILIQAFLVAGLGATLAWLLLSTVRISPYTRALLVVAAALHNSESIPLKMAQVAAGPTGLLGNEPNALATSFAYVSLYHSVNNVIIWTWASSYLRSALPALADSQTKIEVLHDASEGPLSDEILSEKSPIASHSLSPAINSPASLAPTPHWKRRLVKVITHPGFKEAVLSPPTLGVIGGLFIALIPPLRSLCVGGPLTFFMDFLMSLGLASIPLLLMVLGAVMRGNAQRQAESMWSVDKLLPPVLCAFVTLALVPCIGIGALYLAQYHGIITDRVMLWALLSELVTPPNLGVVIVAKVLEYGEEQVVLVLLVTYVLSIGTMPIFLSLGGTILLSQ